MNCTGITIDGKKVCDIGEDPGSSVPGLRLLELDENGKPKPELNQNGKPIVPEDPNRSATFQVKCPFGHLDGLCLD